MAPQRVCLAGNRLGCPVQGPLSYQASRTMIQYHGGFLGAGLAIKDFWGVDGNTVVFVADPNTGNILKWASQLVYCRFGQAKPLSLESNLSQRVAVLAWI